MAVEFLKQKLKNRKIFLKYDTASQDKEGLPLCYVYLDNKTFINNHLIRTGFVEVDLETEYKYRDKFMEKCRKSSASIGGGFTLLYFWPRVKSR